MTGWAPCLLAPGALCGPLAWLMFGLLAMAGAAAGGEAQGAAPADAGPAGTGAEASVAAVAQARPAEARGSGPTHVASASAASSATAWELISPTTFDWRQAEQRRAVAQDLLQRLQLLAAVIPPLSSRQEAQVVNEMGELQRLGAQADAQRRSRLYMSRHYQHFRLLELLADTQGHLQCVLSTPRIAEEMRCWSLASVGFAEEASLDLALSMLRRARLIPKDGAMPVKAQDPAVWYGEYGRGILKHILAPHLAAQAAALE